MLLMRFLTTTQTVGLDFDVRSIFITHPFRSFPLDRATGSTVLVQETDIRSMMPGSKCLYDRKGCLPWDIRPALRKDLSRL
jgi:hypothetical protein